MITEMPLVFPGGDSMLAGVLIHDPACPPAAGVVVTGSWLTVKEQMAMLYARRLAALGYCALVFDFAGFGQSGGEPRQAEIPERKIKDILAAAAFMSGLGVCAPGGLGWVGICASAQYVLRAIARGAPITAFASVAGWFHNPASISPFYGGAEGVARRLELARRDAEAFLQSKPRRMAPAYAPADETAGMHFPLDYYANRTRGAVPAWRNEMAPLSWAHWLLFDGLSAASSNRIPTLMVHGPGCALPDNARLVFEQFAGPKELKWLEGEQIEFYDEPHHVKQAVAAIDAWFEKSGLAHRSFGNIART
jgi:fermentation-respiration switch protein FrsA (DUF1100 family)